MFRNGAIEEEWLFLSSRAHIAFLICHIYVMWREKHCQITFRSRQRNNCREQERETKGRDGGIFLCGSVCVLQETDEAQKASGIEHRGLGTAQNDTCDDQVSPQRWLGLETEIREATVADK